MRGFLRWLKCVFLHLTLCMSAGLALINYLHGRNPGMQFLTSEPSRIYIWILCGLAVITCLIGIIKDLRE